MPYACEPNIPPEALKCATAHCTSFAGTIDEVAWCKCIRFDGKPISGCQPKDNTVPIKTGVCYNKATREQRNISDDACQELRDKDRNWSWRDCYCCCSCFAWFTKILIPDNQVKFVQTIEPRDKVMAGSIEISGGKIHVNWQEASVGFSDGTSPGAASQMIAIQYGAEGEIIATTDQLFLLPDGKLKAANRLTPLDQLVGEDGNPIDIESIRVIKYTGGIHHIGLGEDPPVPVPINRHLISAEGLICGDFWLQVTYASSETTNTVVLASNHATLPIIGSSEYATQKGFSANLFSATRTGVTPRAIRNPFCEEQELKEGTSLLASARQYLTTEQADDIDENAEFYPISVQANVPDYTVTRNIFACAYPDVNLYLEWTDEYPNLYAFEAFGQKTVYISGRLLRAKGIYKEGIAMMLAFGVALFYSGDEKDEEIKACTGLADYFGAGYIMRQAFTFNWFEMTTAGYEQIRALFKHIKKPHRGDDPRNRCLLPSISCRLECMSNALSGKGLPVCSGVPGPGKLSLDSASASMVEGTQSIIAVFSEPVDLESSQQVTNYTIMPETVITTAVRDERDPWQVILTVTLPTPPTPPEGDYTLTVSDVRAENGSTLNPKARTANFKIPPD
ncbi:MAG TPA: hypothetical protein VKJ45_23950 [Blastocatellia bacterium]|nr:hypothetical protein [Blastocatellia bacterium]